LILSQGNRERVRVLYERLLDRTKHVKVWLSYARFEAEPLPLQQQDQQQQDPQQQQQQQQPDQQQQQPRPGESLSTADRASRAARARAVYERGFRSIREGTPDAKEEAVMLLESWRDFEAAGSEFRLVPKS
jgi:crooked neck